MVLLIAIVFLTGLAVGTFCEHYLRPKAKLDTDDMLCVIDLIDVYADNDYERVRAMRDEFGRWMVNPVALEEHLSSELLRIIRQVRDRSDEPI